MLKDSSVALNGVVILFALTLMLRCQYAMIYDIKR